VTDATAAKRVALTFLQHYRENAEYLERTYAYVERVGIEAVSEAVLGEGQAELLERYRIAKAAADPDPWRSAPTCSPQRRPTASPASSAALASALPRSVILMRCGGQIGAGATHR
jgi:NAD(P)H-nitrite reductase large subunit